MLPPTDVTRRVRRVLRRHRRWIAAGCAALAAFALVRAVAPPPQDTSPVVVAAHDLTAGQQLGPGDLRRVDMPAALVPEGTSVSAESLLGRTVAGPMRAGEPVSDHRVVGDALVAGYPDGSVATPVRIDDPDVVALLRVGDEIDVFVAVADDVDDARLVVRGAAVVTLPEPGDDLRDGRLVVLAVQSREAATLAQASAQGPISVSLR